MGATLAAMKMRVQELLCDTQTRRYSEGLIEEGLRQALGRFNELMPLGCETVVDCPGAGREVALNNVDGLMAVTEVWWPYSSTENQWPPNRVQGFRVFWDDGCPVLFLNSRDGSEPQEGDEVRVWYTAEHTIQGLDGADATTLNGIQEALLVQGAAAMAIRAAAAGLDPAAADVTSVVALGKGWQQEFENRLRRSAKEPTPVGEVFSGGWRLDEWDSRIVG